MENRSSFITITVPVHITYTFTTYLHLLKSSSVIAALIVSTGFDEFFRAGSGKFQLGGHKFNLSR